jgi:ribosome recycling factor
MTKETRVANQAKVKELKEAQKTGVRHLRQEQYRLVQAVARMQTWIGKDDIARAEKEIDKEMKAALEKIDKLSQKFIDDMMKA